MLYFQTITQGILLGLTLSLMLGPAFFSLIQTSISDGFKRGMHLAFGISVSDIIMVFIVWYGLSNLFDGIHSQRILSVCGGCFLIGFGIYIAMKRHVTEIHPKEIKLKTKFHIKTPLKGFLFNIANPSIWFFWLLPVSVASSYPRAELQILFLASILLTTLSVDILKCVIANELRRFLSDRVIKIFNIVIGIVLIVFGIYLILTLWIDFAIIFPELKKIQ